MGVKTIQLSFEVLQTNNCKTLSVVDTSIYNTTPEGLVMQVVLPDREEVKELSFTRNSVNLLNSNTLGYSNVPDADDLIDLPDGAYTIKISACPYEDFWFEKDIYRICQLECKYNKAVLELDLNSCQNCYDKHKVDKLKEAWLFIQGVKANTENGNIDAATSCYETANKILEKLLNCDCKHS